MGTPKTIPPTPPKPPVKEARWLEWTRTHQHQHGAKALSGPVSS